MTGTSWIFLPSASWTSVDAFGLLVVKSQVKLDYIEEELAQISNRGEQDLALADPVA